MPAIFVNRVRELDEFESLLKDLERGRRRHLALLGLRRIGKTVLLDEVRLRHPNFAIPYLALDDVVSSPETFARSLVGQILAAAVARKGMTPSLLRTDEALLEMAAALDPRMVELVKEIGVWIERAEYGELLISTMRFPGHVSEILDIPLLLMLDEFQDITRLREFAGTVNLLGTVRAALDRQGKVGFAVAGSRVTALRNLLGGSESPLFTRFGTVSLDPFGPEATAELATKLWDEEGVTYDTDAVVRLYKLTCGWPFYISAVAQRARQVARAADRRITCDTVDRAFREEIFGRGTTIGQHCAYLRTTATEDSSKSEKSFLEELLEQIALHQPLTRANLVRRLVKRHNQREIYRGVNRLIDTDFVAEQSGVLTMLHPIFGLWLASEPARQDPQGLLNNQAAIQKLISWYEQRHADDRTVMGKLFEKRAENLVRQFAGHEIDGKLFGITGKLVLPTVRRVRKVVANDPKGLYGQPPDNYELEIVTAGDTPADCWGVEAKHRQGSVTKAMVERFLENARAIEKAEKLTFVRLWIVANRGVRADALPVIQAEGILVSRSREIEKLEHLAAAGWKAGEQ